MGGCQNYGPFLDPEYNAAPNIYGTQKGTITLTTPIWGLELRALEWRSFGGGGVRGL